MSLIEHVAVPSTPCVTPPLLATVGADLEVPVIGGCQVRSVNLDWAATAPALRAVADAVTAALPSYASVHRGAGLPSQASTARYEVARATVGRFVGAREDDVVVFVRNTTDALNLLAAAVPAGGEVLCLDAEHHANLLPWAQGAHRVLPVCRTIAATLTGLREALHERPTALLAITGASNVTGEVLPLGAIVDVAHAAGARVAVDAAQLAPHRGIDLRSCGADYVAFSGHKLYAPFGTGALVGRRDWLDAAAPHLHGGGAVRDVREAATDWLPAPQRHEAGTPNLLGAVALAAACHALCELPAGALEAHEQRLRAQLLAGLAELDGIRVHAIFGGDTDAIGVVAFTVDGFAPGHVAAYLAAEHGISVRDGRFCAHRLLARLGLSGGALRASLGVGSRADDIERLVDALAQLLAGRSVTDYAVREGHWAPVDDDRDLTAWTGEDAVAVAVGCRAV